MLMRACVQWAWPAHPGLQKNKVFLSPTFNISAPGAEALRWCAGLGAWEAPELIAQEAPPHAIDLTAGSK